MSVFARTSAHLLQASPNYIEVTLLVEVIGSARLLMEQMLWHFSPTLCILASLFVGTLSFVAIGRGKILTFLGWIKPRRPVYWLYALLAGVAGALVVVAILHLTRTPLGSTSANVLLYGATIGPILEEVLYRGAAFSVVYVTACSFRTAMHWRIVLAIVVTSLLFVMSHSFTIGIPWFTILAMGSAYGVMRWRSNSTAVSALMHASYNLLIAVFMLTSKQGNS
jgi:membrane protease YdiL (CAAX protease family)